LFMKSLLPGSDGSVTFGCFTPPVMIATCIIEIALMLMVLVRYGYRRLQLPIVGLLFFLAVFQLCEFMICTGAASDSNDWARLGYFAITLLPPISVDLASRLGGYRQRKVVKACYALAVPYVLYYVFVPGVLTAICGGNYIIVTSPIITNWLYVAYYFGVILVSLWVADRQREQASSKVVKQSLQWFTLGNLAFLLPSFGVVILRSFNVVGFPSVLCGFAVTFALVLGLKVAPLARQIENLPADPSKRGKKNQTSVS